MGGGKRGELISVRKGETVTAKKSTSTRKNTPSLNLWEGRKPRGGAFFIRNRGGDKNRERNLQIF